MIKHKISDKNFNSDEVELFNEVVEVEIEFRKLAAKRKELRNRILEVVRDRNYIYNDEYVIDYIEEKEKRVIDSRDLDYIYTFGNIPELDAFIGTKIISEHIKISKRI